MFTIPVISGGSRYSPDSSGMMHLNALNGSLSNSSSQRGSSSCSNCLPSYEEAVSNGPLFGLFNVNGGDTTTHHHHHHHHHRHRHHSQPHHPHQHHHYYPDNHVNDNNNHIQFPQSYHGPSNDNDLYYLPTYQEVLSPTGSGRDSSKSPLSRPSSRDGSRDDNHAMRLEVEIQGKRLSRMGVSEGSRSLLSRLVPQSPRLKARKGKEKQAIPTCTSKSGNGNDGRLKQAEAEKSTLSVAKDKLYRVFSPMLSRKHDHHRSSSARPGSRQTTLSSSDDENGDGKEKTSLPFRDMCVAPGRSHSNRSGHFDDLKKHRTKHHKNRTPQKRSHRAH